MAFWLLAGGGGIDCWMQTRDAGTGCFVVRCVCAIHTPPMQMYDLMDGSFDV